MCIKLGVEVLLLIIITIVTDGPVAAAAPRDGAIGLHVCGYHSTV